MIITNIKKSLKRLLKELKKIEERDKSDFRTLLLNRKKFCSVQVANAQNTLIKQHKGTLYILDSNFGSGNSIYPLILNTNTY